MRLYPRKRNGRLRQPATSCTPGSDATHAIRPRIQRKLTPTQSSYCRLESEGNQQERTEWHSVAIFNEKLGEIAEKYLRKGAQVYLEGQLQTRKWQDQNGQDRYTTEIVLPKFGGSITLIGGKGEAGDAAPSEAPRQSAAKADLDDDIPF